MSAVLSCALMLLVIKLARCSFYEPRLEMVRYRKQPIAKKIVSVVPPKKSCSKVKCVKCSLTNQVRERVTVQPT